MKALAIRQPWPFAIFNAPERLRKDVENRSRRWTFRGRIVVHASKRPSDPVWNDEWEAYWQAVLGFKGMPPDDVEHLIPLPEQLTFGALIGTVEIADCVASSPSPWFFGPFGLVLREPRPFPTPIPFRGQQGLFDVPDSMLPHR